jgi:hypothetical protein
MTGSLSTTNLRATSCRMARKSMSLPNGTKSASYGDLGACIDHNAQVLLAQKLLSELARGAAKDMKSH